MKMNEDEPTVDENKLKEQVLQFMEAEPSPETEEWVHPVSLWFKGEEDPLSYIKTPKDILDFSDFLMRYTHAGWAINADDFMAEAALLKLCLYIMLGEYPKEMTIKNLYIILRMCNYIASPKDMHMDFGPDYATAFEIFYDDLMTVGYRHNEAYLNTYDHYFQLFANSVTTDITEIANRIIDRLDEAKYLYGDAKFFEIQNDKGSSAGKKPNAKARTTGVPVPPPPMPEQITPEEEKKLAEKLNQKHLSDFFYRMERMRDGGRREDLRKQNVVENSFCRVIEADNGDMMFFPQIMEV